MPSKRVKIDPLTPSSAVQNKNRGTQLLVWDMPNTPLPALTGRYIENSDSSLAESGSDNEDKGKANEEGDTNESGHDIDEDEDQDEDGVEWEDVFQATIEPAPEIGAPSSPKKMDDLELILESNRPEISTDGKKKGASAQQRRIRAATHCLHVQFLLFHGAVRNGWICDSELHAILLSHLTPGIMEDIEKFQTREGKKSGKEAVTKNATDPVLKILETLIHWWRKKFTTDRPGMRKNGYKTLSQFQDEKEQEGEKFWFTTGNREKGGQETYTWFMNQGEKVENLEGLRKLAKECRGSRDTGATLFTALLRAIGLEARMILSLQPLGFGFTESENFTEIRLPIKEKAREQPRESAKGDSKSKDKEFVTGSEDSEDDEDYYSGGFIREESTPDLPRPKKPAYDGDLPYPIFWSEVYSATSNKWITVESLVLTVLGSSPDLLAKFEPKGKRAAGSKQAIAYVVAYSSNGTAKDVTVRYLHRNTFPGKAKGFRIPITNIPVYDYEGKVVTTRRRDWFEGVMRGYRTPEHLRMEREKEEDDELRGFILKPREPKGEQKESISFYKNNPEYVLERHLKREEAVRSGKSHVKTFIVGKGEKGREEKVYSRGDIASCKTVENWYREGRVIREGQQPLKRVKPRVATLNRKREIEEAKRDGEIVMQGLYSEEQTKLYRPPPIMDGRIPRNSFGNIDIYVPSMIPPRAIHLPLKGSAKLARRLGIDYAEAVTGFEFKKQRAVPMIEGIIVAEENGDLLHDAWREEEGENKKRADGKRERRALAMWRRFLMGLRIVARLREEYGDEDGGAVDVNPFMARKSNQNSEKQPIEIEREANDEVEEGGGLFREGGMGGGFISDGGSEVDGGGGFLSGEIVLDEESCAPSDSVFVSSTNIPAQVSAMSLRDMLTQKEKRLGGGNTEYDPERETQRPTASPEVRSAHFVNGIAVNGEFGGRPSVISLNTKDGVSAKPLGEDVGQESCAKTRIEVQVPATRVTPARKTTYRASKASGVLVLDSTDTETPSSSGTRRVPKRKVAERKQSKYFMDGGVASDGGGESKRRRTGRILRGK